MDLQGTLLLALNTIAAIIYSHGQSPDECRALVCNGAGWCTAGGAGCDCDTGRWNTTDDGRTLWITYEYDRSTNCSSCNWNYFGVNCTQWGLACRADRCNGNGTCVGRWNGCTCDQFQNPETNCTTCLGNWWNVTSCSTCQPEWFGQQCNQTASECSVARCEGHGQCVNQTSGCQCDTGWLGDRCQYPIPPEEGLSGIQIGAIVGGIVGSGVLIALMAKGYEVWQERKKKKEFKKIK
jgi:hypothetical protein